MKPQKNNFNVAIAVAPVMPQALSGAGTARGSLVCRRHAPNTQSDYKPISVPFSKRPIASVASKRKRRNEPEKRALKSIAA